jgi:hypothetical protein
MESIQEYLRQADQCEQQAAEAQLESSRVALLTAAVIWRKLVVACGGCCWRGTAARNVPGVYGQRLAPRWRASKAMFAGVQLRTDSSLRASYVSEMTKETALTKTELIALAAVDGTPAQPTMRPEIKSRLMGLYLIERREWPGGPLWRTPKGDRRTKARK